MKSQTPETDALCLRFHKAGYCPSENGHFELLDLALKLEKSRNEVIRLADVLCSEIEAYSSRGVESQAVAAYERFKSYFSLTEPAKNGTV
jgi:hypothetical protein